ncbi:MAG TPA: DUF4097 family beta strand repeat-containing protein [Longimicrobium sp.]
MIYIAALAALISLPACAQQRVDERRPTGPGGTVDVTLLSGTVRVVTWGRNEVQVTGELGRGTDRLEIRSEGDRTYVQAVIPRGTRNAGMSEIEVRIPARKSLVVRTTSADAEVQGVLGGITVTTVSGDVQVAGRPASLEVTTRSGGVGVDVTTDRVRVQSVSGDLAVRGDVRTEVEAQTVSGEISVAARTGSLRAQSVSGGVTAPSVGGRAEVQTVSGDISVQGSRLRGSFESVSGGVLVSGALERGGTTTLNSHSGDVELRLARGSGAEVEFTTFSGEMEMAISGARVTRTSRREQEVLVGRGGARVEVRTFSGDVKLADR